VFTNEAVSFIRSSRSPFFLYLAYSAPHSKYIPAPGDEGAFRHLSPFDGPSFGERNVSDKPAYVRTHPRTKVWAERAEKTRGGQLRTLLAVDRGVGRLVDTLRRTGRLANTMIVFTSDNGFMWGEHRLLGKGTAYDESIRVPLVVRYDPLTAAHPRVDDHLVENLDFAPTFADLANVPSPGAQGMTLLELLARQGSAWRTRLLIEHMQEPTVRPIPSFCAVRTERWLFVQYDTGERELYRLQTDPGEMRSLVGRQAFRQAEQRLRAWTLAECHPRPPHWLTARIG
jgi:arylsulfatase A-like enzyme